MPTTAGAVRPELAAASTTRDRRPLWSARRPASRCGARRNASDGGDAAEDDDEQGEAEPEDGPVERRAPASGTPARTGPSGVSGDSATATTTARSAPTTTAARTPTSPSATVDLRPGAERAQHLALVIAAAQLAGDRLRPAITSATNAAMAPKAPSAIDSGLIASSTWVDDRREWRGTRTAGRAGSPRTSSRSTAPTSPAPWSSWTRVGRGRRSSGRDRPRSLADERGGQHDEAERGVDVVLRSIWLSRSTTPTTFTSFRRTSTGLDSE